MIEEILSDVYRIEIPLPGSSLKSLNSYVIKSPQRHLIIDTGWDRKECMIAMQAGLKKLYINIEKTDFFITHFHTDHLGLALNLAPETSTIFFNQPDADRVHSNINREHFMNFAMANGFPENEFQELRQKFPRSRYISTKKPSFHILKENDALNIGDKSFTCIHTPGHTNGHMCLYETNEKIFVSGDHILNDISPNIQLWSNDDNPLKEYLASLDKIQWLDIDLVLPGHRGIFRNCNERIQELKHHHYNRCNEILSILKKERKNAYQAASVASWSISNKYMSWSFFPVLQKWFATGEMIAHLKYLEEEGLVNREASGEKILFHRA